MEGTLAAGVTGVSWSGGQGQDSQIFFLVLETYKKFGNHKGGEFLVLPLLGNGKSEGERVTHGTHFFH